MLCKDGRLARLSKDGDVRGFPTQHAAWFTVCHQSKAGVANTIRVAKHKQHTPRAERNTPYSNRRRRVRKDVVATGQWTTVTTKCCGKQPCREEGAARFWNHWATWC